MTDAPSITLTPSKIGFVLAIVSIVGVGWQTASYFKDQEQRDKIQDVRLDRTDEDRAITKELSLRTGELKEAVVKLTVTIETNSLSRRAETYPQIYNGGQPAQTPLPATKAPTR